MFARFRLLAVVLVAVSAHARTASELHLAIKKLNVVGSALYVAAHPDDENTAMLAWLANERLVRTGYLSITRGDGGQNLIGDEKGELLGIVRTQELLAARRIDGAEQFFTRAIDFGYSKNAEETLGIWNHEQILSDVVRIVRDFQPDVIITRFPTTGEGGHGHHTASALLAKEAFSAAADPTRFPDQLQNRSVWSPKRIFWNRFSWQRIDPNSPEVAGDLRIDLGSYNRLLGRAYTEIAAESRSEHKSQGFGSAERRGTIINYFNLMGGEPARHDLFEGIDLTWKRYPGGEALSAILQRADQTFDPQNPHKSIPVLLNALVEMDRVGALPEWSPRANRWVEIKRRELLEAVRLAAGLSIEANAGDSMVVPGAEIPVSVTVVNRSDYPFTLAAVASPQANPGKAPGAALENNKPVKVDVSIKIPADTPYSQPYWLRQPPTGGAYTVSDPALIGRPENPPAIPITVTLQDQLMNTLVFTVPAVYRWTDPVKGEQIRSVDVVPEVTANVGASVYLFPEKKPRQITVWLRTFADVKYVRVRMLVPKGWQAEPPYAAVTFEGKGDERRTVFTVTPPPGETTDHVAAQVELPSGKRITLGLIDINYEHIRPQRVLGDAAAKVVRVDVKKTGRRIGYIMGSGDDVPNALRQLGYEVTPLSDIDLDRGDFSAYDAVVTGVRAYNTRKRLKLAHPRLMEYVFKGGTLVVQYNTLDDIAVAAPGPFPFKISRDRVTVEDAPVKMLAADHPLFTVPNKIVQDDFEDWVQERGLYFANEWDRNYSTVLATADPGETVKEGGQLYARYGEGVFIYTSYAWFRQLPAGVPGAYKLFANLVSAR